MENTLLLKKHVLICIEPNESEELEYLKSKFCGTILSDEYVCKISDGDLFLCGNVEKFKWSNDRQVFVIRELSFNYEKYFEYTLISIGQVPINIHNVGVFYRNLFGCSKDYFNSVNTQHEFQSLTESNKIGNAYRTGIYLTKVEEDSDELKFNLLRCSTNLNGPTDNFRSVDNEIIEEVNDKVGRFFNEKVEFNHVLAQIYTNAIILGNKERKAKISEHSDKTKDMPRNSGMAFCTFYKDLDKKRKIENSFDYMYNGKSILTSLRFRLKKCVSDENMEKEFNITLYPNSVFIIPLSTNRLYTHEIIPSSLPIDKIPTRMGYVIRHSKTKAVHKNNETYINENGNYKKLEKYAQEDIKKLKELYFKENVMDELVEYNNIYFSLNEGDYKCPIV